jgi:hypothetical protein
MIRESWSINDKCGECGGNTFGYVLCQSCTDVFNGREPESDGD